MNSLSNKSDQLLSDRYKLTKKIKALNITLQDSSNNINDLERELNNKLELKEKPGMIDNNGEVTDEIQMLRDKIKYRNIANSELSDETENLKRQLKNIQEEIFNLKIKEEK